MNGKHFLSTFLVLIGLLHAIVPFNLEAACSSYYLGRAVINEVDATGNNDYFVEVKVLDETIDSIVYDGWMVTICSNSKKVDCVGPILLSATGVDDSDYPWLVINPAAIGDSDYIEFKDGMDILLQDASGDTIDYLTITGYNPQQPAASCTPAFEWQATGDANTHTLGRLPDGTGEWNQFGTGNSVPPTTGDTNDVVPDGVTPPSLSISDGTVDAGSPAQFTLTLSAISGYDVVVTYFAIEGTAVAGIHFDSASLTPSTITIPAGSLTSTISVDTYNPVGFDNAVDFHLVVTQAVLYDAGTSNPVIDNSGNIVYVPRTNNFALATINVPTAGALDSFAIDTGGLSGSTCSPQAITIIAIDNTGGILTSYSGTIGITTATSHGDWAVNSALGILSNGTGDDGAATYTFVATDNGSIILDFTNTHPEALTISISDVGASITSTSSTISFSANSFVIYPTASTGGIPNSTEIVVGRDHGFQIEMWLQDPITGNCSIASSYNGNFGLKSWLTRNGDDPSGTAPEISGSSLSDGAPGADNLNLNFVNGAAAFDLVTKDAGKYVLNVRDDSLSITPVIIDGSSSVLTVRPFGFGFTGIQSGAVVNPGGTAHDSAVFTKAGETFQATLTAYGWQGSDDVDNDGIPDTASDLTDNVAVSSFGWTAHLSASLGTPAGGVAGSLAGTTSPAAASFAAGSVAVNDMTYSDIGSMILTAVSSDYLNTVGVTVQGTSQDIGRFIPDYFEVVNNVFTTACPFGNFTYMGQDALQIDFSVEAKNKSGGKTSNYFGNFAKATLSFVAENNNDGVDLSSRLSGFTAGTWSAGAYSHTVTNGEFARDTVPNGPYDDLNIGYSLSDNDGNLSSLINLDMNPGTSDICLLITSCTAYSAGNTGMLYGRLFLSSNYGPETEDLSMPLLTQYYDGTDFTVNLNDQCSNITIAFVAGSYTDNLDPGETCVQDSGNPGDSGEGCPAAGPAGYQFLEPPSSGDFNCYLKAPGSDNNGTVDVTASEQTSGIWLQYDWDNDPGTPDADPLGKATFGIYRGNDRIINWREVVR